jgi:FOG: FHA domain
MSVLVFTLLRFGFLVLLWVFVLAVVVTLRRDVHGTQIQDRRPRRNAPPPSIPASRRKQPRQPTERHVVLAVTGGPLAGTVLPLGTAPIIIGRSPDSALVLDDTFSSSRHARLYVSDGQWWIEDLDSTNGTYIAGHKITAPTPLYPGQQIQIGKTTLELRQ